MQKVDEGSYLVDFGPAPEPEIARRLAKPRPTNWDSVYSMTRKRNG